MTAVMKGVRILEVAEHTFVPAASALLSDWGAEIVKIEHVERGDAMRGLATAGAVDVPDDVHTLLEHSNRGKKSLAVDLASPEGREILYKLAATADVFLTNKLPRVRKKLKIEAEQIREHNPRIIYVCGTGQGERGPDADKGSYDSLAFWARAGMAMSSKRPEYGDLMPMPPAPGYGDSIGGMTIAGGIMGALFHRERTGEATTVDVSLLAAGMWAMGQGLALSWGLKRAMSPPPADVGYQNPLVGYYGTKDGRKVAFTCLQAGKYWPELISILGRPELAVDQRFAGHDALLANGEQAKTILSDIFLTRTAEDWRHQLDVFSGQWTPVQDTLEVADDPQALANGYVQDCETASGTPFRLVAAPVQFGGQPAAPGRAPGFNEHGDEILAELGFDWDTVIDLKVRNIVA